MQNMSEYLCCDLSTPYPLWNMVMAASSCVDAFLYVWEADQSWWEEEFVKQRQSENYMISNHFTVTVIIC